MKAALIVSALVLATAPTWSQVPSAGPHLPYFDWGACPFECCTYREWVAAGPVDVYKTRDPKRPVLFKLTKGERVLALTGVVITTKLGITEVAEPIKLGYLPDGSGPLLSLEPGDILYALHYQGEGSSLFWYKGKTYSDAVSGTTEPDDPSGLKVRSNPLYDWWVKVKNKTGQVGWALNNNSFNNSDACG